MTIQTALDNARLSADSSAICEIQMQNYKQDVEFVVVDSFIFDAVIGMNWMMMIKPEIKWDVPRRLEFVWQGEKVKVLEEIKKNGRKQSQMEMVLDEKATRQRERRNNAPAGTMDPKDLLISNLQLKRAVRKCETKCFLAFIRNRRTSKDETATRELKSDQQALLDEFSTIFKSELPDELPPARAIDHKIELKPDAKPVS